MLSLDTAVHSSVDFVVANSVENSQKGSWYIRYGKRTFDISIAIFVIVFILSWMIPIVGCLIWLTSSGPILFRQKRTGREGQTFYCLKFRTMYHNPKAYFAQCEKNDSRVTPIGKFLRKTNLDEMPQFLNVLLGDMSIVGPRPHAIEHDDKYWFALPNYYVRYQVRPGITGLAQVRGARGETKALAKMKHRVQYDLLYVKRQSAGLDVKLCVMTLGAMIKGNVNAW